MLKLAYELHGLHLLFPVCAAARAGKFDGVSRACVATTLRNLDPNAQRSDTRCATGLGCEGRHTASARVSVTSFLSTIDAIWRDGSVVLLQPSPDSHGVDGDAMVSEWYEVVPNDVGVPNRPLNGSTAPTSLSVHVHRCQVLANSYGIKHIIRNWTIWGTAPPAARQLWGVMNCTHRAE